VVKTSSETLSLEEYRALLRRDFISFAQRCFRELNPKTRFAMGWHIGLRREAGGAARRQDPAAHHQPAAAASEVAAGVGRVSGLVPRV
jgi:hypothetical protein